MKPLFAAAAGVAGAATIAVLTLPNLLTDEGPTEVAERFATAVFDNDYEVVCDLLGEEMRPEIIGDSPDCAAYVATMQASNEQNKATASQQWGVDYDTVMKDYQVDPEVVYTEDHADHAVVGVRISESYDGDFEGMTQHFTEGEPKISLMELELEEHNGDWVITRLSNSSAAA